MSLFTPEREQAWIKASGREFAGWTEVGISSSIETVARTFTFKAAARWPGELHPLRIRPGSEVEVYIGKDRVVSGWIDKLDAGHDSKSHSITVAGRSKTGDLVDCSPIDAPVHYRKKTPLRIVRALAADYGVSVRSEAELGDALRRFDLGDGELVGAAIQRLALARGFLATDNEDGELVLTRAGDGEAEVALVVGENVLSGTASIDVSGRFSEYRVRSVRVGDDNDYGEALQAEGVAEDTEDLGRRRVLDLQSERGEDKARAKERATWEAATRYGQSIALSYVVQGWRQTEGGALWRPNLLVPVVDDLAGVDGIFLVVDCDFTLGSSTTTKLTLAPVEGYELLPPMKPRRRKGRPASRAKNPFDALKDGVDLGAQATGTGQSSATGADL